MLHVAPFCGIRYDFSRLAGDLSAVLAPPYDVLDHNDKNALLANSDRNIVAIDLPHIPPKAAGPAEAYAASARLLESWLADGTLIRESAPALYVYHQRFLHAGRTYTRRQFIARVRLEPFSEGVILPHERTFGGPKEDRLALMKATKCNLSPVFGLYADPENEVGSAFAATTVNQPDAVGTLDGVENRLWVVTDPETIARVSATMAPKKLYIADGHHRYATALMHRDWFAGTQGGSIAADHPANFVMFVLASMNDPGCLIIPYPRALANVELGTLLDAWAAGTEQVSAGQADIVLYEGSSDRELALRFTQRDELKTLAPEQCAPWYELDAAYLHRYLIDELLRAELGSEPQVRYVKSADSARQTARDESGVALLVNATPMAHLRAVSEAGGLMPQKSTYFYPKLATGLTINPLR